MLNFIFSCVFNFVPRCHMSIMHWKTVTVSFFRFTSKTSDLCVLQAFRSYSQNTCRRNLSSQLWATLCVMEKGNMCAITTSASVSAQTTIPSATVPLPTSRLWRTPCWWCQSPGQPLIKTLKTLVSWKLHWDWNVAKKSFFFSTCYIFSMENSQCCKTSRCKEWAWEWVCNGKANANKGVSLEMDLMKRTLYSIRVQLQSTWLCLFYLLLILCM